MTPELKQQIAALLASKARGGGSMSDPIVRYVTGQSGTPIGATSGAASERPQPAGRTRSNVVRAPAASSEGDDLAALMSKVQTGFGVVRPGEGVEWARVPEAKRKALEPALAEALGKEPPIGWALGDLSERDMQTLQRLIGDKAWGEWKQRNADLSTDPNWQPGEQVRTRADVEAMRQRVIEDMRAKRQQGGM